MYQIGHAAHMGTAGSAAYLFIIGREDSQVRRRFRGPAAVQLILRHHCRLGCARLQAALFKVSPDNVERARSLLWRRWLSRNDKLKDIIALMNRCSKLVLGILQCVRVVVYVVVIDSL